MEQSPPYKGKQSPQPGPEPTSARAVAAQKLAGQARRWPDFDLAPLRTDHLAPRDAALAHAIYDAGMRRWLTLEWLLGQFLEKPLSTLEPALQGILISGAVQLVFLDRVPDHAATDETVELSKTMVRSGAAAITNAVLRRIAETVGERTREVGDEFPRDRLPLSDGEWISLKGVALPEAPLPRLGIATSHPAWLVKRWAMQRARNELQTLLMHSLVHPPTILNTAHAVMPVPGSLRKHSQAGCHVFEGARGELESLLRDRTDIWVQDPASCRAVAGARQHFSSDPALIIDACAGQGTKTRHLQAAFPSSSIVATDTDERRLSALESEFHGSSRVRVMRPEDLLLEFSGRADLILLDVPCTNTGVLARRVEAKYRCDDEQLKRLTSVQKQIIADSIALIRGKPRGRILYSTCSLEPEENQAQADWTSRWHALKVLQHESTRPKGVPGGDSSVYSDGAFWALMG